MYEWNEHFSIEAYVSTGFSKLKMDTSPFHRLTLTCACVSHQHNSNPGLEVAGVANGSEVRSNDVFLLPVHFTGGLFSYNGHRRFTLSTLLRQYSLVNMQSLVTQILL